MPATYGHNEVYRDRPPVSVSIYVPRGTYKPEGGMKTCQRRPYSSPAPSPPTINADMTGPADANKGLISIFLILGYLDQTF